MVNEKQSAELTQIEIAKTSDFLLVEYGFQLEDLLWNIQKQKLDEKPEIAGFKKMFMLQKQTEAKKRAAKCAISEEQISEMKLDAEKIGPPEYKSDGTLTYDYFIELSKIQYRYTHNLIAKGSEEAAKERRQLLKDEKMDEYETHCVDLTNWQTDCRKNVQNKVFELLNIKKEVADKSYQTYLGDKER